MVRQFRLRRKPHGSDRPAVTSPAAAVDLPERRVGCVVYRSDVGHIEPFPRGFANGFPVPVRSRSPPARPLVPPGAGRARGIAAPGHVRSGTRRGLPRTDDRRRSRRPHDRGRRGPADQRARGGRARRRSPVAGDTAPRLRRAAAGAVSRQPRRDASPPDTDAPLRPDPHEERARRALRIFRPRSRDADRRPDRTSADRPGCARRRSAVGPDVPGEPACAGGPLHDGSQPARLRALGLARPILQGAGLRAAGRTDAESREGVRQLPRLRGGARRDGRAREGPAREGLRLPEVVLHDGTR